MDPGDIVLVVQEGFLKILLLEMKVKIELITPTLHVEDQIPVVALLTVEAIKVVLQTKVVLLEAPKPLLGLTSTHQET